MISANTNNPVAGMIRFLPRRCHGDSGWNGDRIASFGILGPFVERVQPVGIKDLWAYRKDAA